MGETPNTNQSFTHVLQKAGVLKNFSVAKVVSRKEIDDLKLLIKTVAKDNAEYEKLFKEEMEKMGNLHDPKAPIPGIIYIEDPNAKVKHLVKVAKEIASKIKNSKMSKRDTCFLIASIIKELGLTQDDFLKLNEEETGEDQED